MTNGWVDGPRSTGWADPVVAFREIAARHPRAFWLDGGGARAWSGRRSIIGRLDDQDVSLTYDAGRREVTRHDGSGSRVVGRDIFTALAAAMAQDDGDPSTSWVGYFGYASRPDLPAQPATGPGPSTGGRVAVPDALWMRARQVLTFEHPEPRDEGGRSDPGPIGPATSPSFEEYSGWFDRVQEELRRGNSYEVNLTYRVDLESAMDPVTAYLRLRELNPAPYAGYLQHNGVSVLSSSPERFATIDRHRWIETKPIKGTTPRGATDEEDRQHRESLATDPRYRAENLMIVDLLRNDLSMVCEPGTVSVPALMQVESYASVHQLVSTVRGHLRDGIGTVDALRTIFPAGSMTGAPKLRTMEIIADVETSPRGVYAGALGWISGDGRADLGVVIRTLVATPTPSGMERPADDGGDIGGSVRGYRYQLGTGGGITVRSDARSEYDETSWKVARLRSVFQPR